MKYLKILLKEYDLEIGESWNGSDFNLYKVDDKKLLCYTGKVWTEVPERVYLAFFGGFIEPVKEDILAQK